MLYFDLILHLIPQFPPGLHICHYRLDFTRISIGAPLALLFPIICRLLHQSVHFTRLSSSLLGNILFNYVSFIFSFYHPMTIACVWFVNSFFPVDTWLNWDRYLFSPFCLVPFFLLSCNVWHPQTEMAEMFEGGGRHV